MGRKLGIASHPVDRYVIEGSYPIRGRIRASGNKNAALPCIAASLLTAEPVTLENIPEIEDVHVMLEILSELGCTVKRLEKPGHYTIDASGVSGTDVPPELSRRIRASILLAGPLVARLGRAQLPPPGGDVIGRRRLDTHFLALGALGAQVEVDGVFTLTANKLVGVDLFLDEASVTATENAIMASVLAEGRTTIQNAASEPHVQDLCHMLNGMGARITGIGSNILTIAGVKELNGTTFKIGSDFMEVGSFIGLAAVTRGELVIEDANPASLRMTKIAFGKLGIHWERDGDNISVSISDPNGTYFDTTILDTTFASGAVGLMTMSQHTEFSNTSFDTPGGTDQVVPEPSTLAVWMVLGGIGIAVIRRKKRN